MLLLLYYYIITILLYDNFRFRESVAALLLMMTGQIGSCELSINDYQNASFIGMRETLEIFEIM